MDLFGGLKWKKGKSEVPIQKENYREENIEGGNY